MTTTQLCDTCRNPEAEEVDTSLYAGEYLLVCGACRRYFPQRRKVYWGTEVFKYYWNLGESTLQRKKKKYRGKKYGFTLTQAEVVHLRALGFAVKKR